jgi:hypothetical protein
LRGRPAFAAGARHRSLSVRRREGRTPGVSNGPPDNRRRSERLAETDVSHPAFDSAGVLAPQVSVTVDPSSKVDVTLARGAGPSCSGRRVSVGLRGLTFLPWNVENRLV